MSPGEVSEILRHLSRLDTALGRVEEKQKASEDKQDEILIQVKATNGRVTAIERRRLIEEGASLQRAATIEDVRQTRAADLAKNAWVKPGVLSAATAVVVVVLDRVVSHLF